MAGCLADHHRLNQITDDRHQATLGLFVAIVASKEQQPADGNLDIGRIELGLQLGDLHKEFLPRRLRVGKLQDQFLARHFQFIELAVEDGKARPAFGMPVLDLLHQALLGYFDGIKFGRHRRFAAWRTLQHSDLMGDHLLRNPVEDGEGVEGRGDAIEDTLFEFLARNRLAVATAFAAKVVARQALLAVGAAIAILIRSWHRARRPTTHPR